MNDSPDYQALKLRICVRFASTFNVERVAVLTYDLVICKDSNDCLTFAIDIQTQTYFTQTTTTMYRFIIYSLLILFTSFTFLTIVVLNI